MYKLCPFLKTVGGALMKISSKGRYAMHIMLDLALSNNGETIRLKDIAKRQELSEKYLEQIIAVLNKAGYVKSVRGPQGGYSLAMKPKEYTVGMILRLTEGSLSPIACLDSDVQECAKSEQCVTLRLWEQLDEAIKGVIDRITLADLVEWQQKKIYDYVI